MAKRIGTTVVLAALVATVLAGTYVIAANVGNVSGIAGYNVTGANHSVAYANTAAGVNAANTTIASNISNATVSTGTLARPNTVVGANTAIGANKSAVNVSESLNVSAVSSLGVNVSATVRNAQARTSNAMNQTSKVILSIKTAENSVQKLISTLIALDVRLHEMLAAQQNAKRSAVSSAAVVRALVPSILGNAIASSNVSATASTSARAFGFGTQQVVESNGVIDKGQHVSLTANVMGGKPPYTEFIWTVGGKILGKHSRAINIIGNSTLVGIDVVSVMVHDSVGHLASGAGILAVRNVAAQNTSNTANTLTTFRTSIIPNAIVGTNAASNTSTTNAV